MRPSAPGIGIVEDHSSISELPGGGLVRCHGVLTPGNVGNILSETSCSSLVDRTEISNDPLEKKTETCGRLVPHIKAKILSKDNATRILPWGQHGELLIASFSLIKGYYKQPGKTNEVLVTDSYPEQWLRTGDEATIDQDGYAPSRVASKTSLSTAARTSTRLRSSSAWPSCGAPPRPVSSGCPTRSTARSLPLSCEDHHPQVPSTTKRS